MPWDLPGRGGTSTVFNRTISPGDSGIAVWAVQKALNVIGRSGVNLSLDGDYGPVTKKAVERFQDSTSGLSVDGVVGTLTQRKIVGIIIDSRERGLDAPAGILRSAAQYEGGWLVAPLNWSSPGGVDCGGLQRRVYESNYNDDAAIQRAFDIHYQAALLATRLEDLFGIFISREGTQDGLFGMSPHEKAWRLAVLNHNYPSGADRLSRTPAKNLSSYWTSPQSWVTNHNLRFPDGAPIRTPLEWCMRYAVGNPTHKEPGQAVSLVRSWS